MKRGTPDHPKTFQLAEALGIRRVHAVGILEMLFHFTAQYAPEGDIGRYPDKRIAAALDWASGVPRLIDSLVATGWVDRHSVARLVLHDWHEHADRHVLQRLSRGGKKPIEQDQADSGILCTQSETNDFSDRNEQVGLPVPVPVPLRASPETGSGTARGSRLSIETIPSEWIEWCQSDLGWNAASAQKVFQSFADYWIAKPGAGGRKADWAATWRNWCRREGGSGGQKPATVPKPISCQVCMDSGLRQDGSMKACDCEAGMRLRGKPSPRQAAIDLEWEILANK